MVTAKILTGFLYFFPPLSYNSRKSRAVQAEVPPMREFHIGKNDENQRLDRFLGKAVPLLPASLAQKYIRLKRIKVNGARAQRDQKLCAGDVLQCYINDEFFETPSEENVYLTITTPRLKIVYEDENIMLLDKPAGMLAHADEHARVSRPLSHHRVLQRMLQPHLRQSRGSLYSGFSVL